jgi:hypothetical protein
MSTQLVPFGRYYPLRFKARKINHGCESLDFGDGSGVGQVSAEQLGKVVMT